MPLARLFADDDVALHGMGVRLRAARHAGDGTESPSRRHGVERHAAGPGSRATVFHDPPRAFLRWPLFRDCPALVRAGLLSPGECSAAAVFEARKGNSLGTALTLVAFRAAFDRRPIALFSGREASPELFVLSRVAFEDTLLARALARGADAGPASRLIRDALAPLLAAVLRDAACVLEVRAERGAAARLLSRLGFESRPDGALRLTRAGALAKGLLGWERAGSATLGPLGARPPAFGLGVPGLVSRPARGQVLPDLGSVPPCPAPPRAEAGSPREVLFGRERRDGARELGLRVAPRMRAARPVREAAP